VVCDWVGDVFVRLVLIVLGSSSATPRFLSPATGLKKAAMGWSLIFGQNARMMFVRSNRCFDG